MKHPDYTTIAGSFDFARRLSGQTLELWLSLLQKSFPPGMKDLLDLGCGTGRFALPIAAAGRTSDAWVARTDGRRDGVAEGQRS